MLIVDPPHGTGIGNQAGLSRDRLLVLPPIALGHKVQVLQEMLQPELSLRLRLDPKLDKHLHWVPLWVQCRPRQLGGLMMVHSRRRIAILAISMLILLD